MKPTQAIYDAASGQYVIDSISGNPMIVHNVVDRVFGMIRQDALEEFLDGSGTRHTGLELQIRRDQIRRVVNLLKNHPMPEYVPSDYLEGYSAAFRDILDALDKV
jgi:hypothetical protein